MKTQITRKLIVTAAVMTLASPLLLSAAPSSPDPSAAPSASPATSFGKQMQRLDNQLDKVFADTFRDIDGTFADHDLASLDVREQKNKYVVRVYVPEADTSKVKAKVEGNTLHIIAAGEQTNNHASSAERYEQIVSLPGPVDVAKMRVQRKKNLVVISLPKGSVATTASVTPPSANPGASPPTDLSDFDQAVVNRMARMQGRMEQLFRDAFPNELTSGFTRLQLGSAVNVDDQKGNYVVRFYLPDRDLKDVNVKLENGQLHLTASETQSSQKKGMQSTESGNYEQLMTLPGPVKKGGMQVERKDGTIVVTLPKA